MSWSISTANAIKDSDTPHVRSMVEHSRRED